jgi:glutaredoxin 3
MIIEIYGKDACSQCEMALYKAQAMVQENTNKLTYKKLGVDFNREELLEQFPTARTFPQIKIDGVSIGGWTEFQKI